MILNSQEIKTLRKNGKVLSLILGKLLKMVYQKKTGDEIEFEANKLIKSAGGYPAFKEVKNEKNEFYPASICLSLNEEVVHALPFDKVIRSGDVVSIDLGLRLDNLITDMAWTVYLDGKDKKILRMLEANKEALYKSSKISKVFNYTSDLSKIIEAIARKYGFFPVKELTGHGVGKTLHEKPTIFNYVVDDKKERLILGMALAIEPIFALKEYKQLRFSNNWAIIAPEGNVTSHFESTVLVTKKEGEILTPSP